MAAIQVETDVCFGSGGGRDLRCDIFRPADARMRTAALLVHGGGWRRGSRQSLHARARQLAEAGIVAVTPEYRLSDEARWPAHIHDVKAAIRWLRANAGALAVDADRLALVGFSAGAQLSLVAAGTPGLAEFSGEGGHAGESEEVNAVVAFFPPILMSLTPGSDDRVPATPAQALRDDITEDQARAASPIEYVRPEFPPTMLLHGTADELVPARTSQVLFDSLTAAGVDADLRLYTGMRHEFINIDEMLGLAMGDVALFLRRVLVEPSRFDVSQRELFGG